MTYGDYIDFTPIKKVLIIKLRHHGDVLLSSPVFSLLKKRHPHLEIDALVYKDTAPMLEGHPAISQMLTYDKNWKKLSFFKRLFKEGALYWKVRAQKYDMVISLTEGDRGALLAKCSKAPWRVGLDPKKSGFLAKGKCFTHLVKRPSTPRHTVEKDLDALRRIGIFPDALEKDLFLHISEEAQKQVKRLLEPSITGSYIVIHPVSRWKFKCPPMNWFAQLIRALEEKGFSVVITASSDPEEMKMAEQLLSLLENSQVLSLAGKTSLKQLSALIKGAKHLITVDSVPLHIASATKTPVVALFGPSSEANWGPWMHPQGHVITENRTCRPCHLDGCGGSKVSDCLQNLPIHKIVYLILEEPHLEGSSLVSIGNLAWFARKALN